MRWVVMVGLALLVLAEPKDDWSCPNVEYASCSCDLPHTLRCTGRQAILPYIRESLIKHKHPYYISLLDLSLQDLEYINYPILQGVSLHGLVISSGILKKISPDAFKDLKQPLEALGLPNNLLTSVPTQTLKHLNSLIRLDLSHNSIFTLQEQSFKGLPSLEFLDLSGNNLQNVSATAFLQLPRLKNIHLETNILSIGTISKLRGLKLLEELDVSNNLLTGPLNTTTLPKLPSLMSLNLAHNQISSITKGALCGLALLKTLILKYNMIDVLEDHSFSCLTALSSLDLAHNRIVAVSEYSLAHLKNLQLLDVSHNFLRALTEDLVSPLISLKELNLDDNDISIISNNALDSANHLEVLTLSDNPLNCDCNLEYFANWLHNATIRSQYKLSAVCATPPSLENGLVEKLSIDQLVCSSDDDLPVNDDDDEHPMPVSGSRVNLQGFNYDGTTIYLLWKIDTVSFYYCDSLFVYEELGTHEILLEHNKLQCNSTSLIDPHSLPVSMKAPNLQRGHKYRYCVVMVEKTETESALILGCSEVIALNENVTPQILTLKANMTPSNILSIHAQVWPQNFPCLITFYISAISKRFKQTKLNCSSPRINLKGFTSEGPFKICAVISELAPFCIWTYPKHTEADKGKAPSLIMLIIFVVIIGIIVVILFRWLKTVFNKPKMREQCFLSTPHNEQQHSRYVKLQATTKL